jgi:16S rRNA processing protein RimM
MSMIWEEMALVGRIARPHGIRGHLVVNPDTDFLEERFYPGAELFVNRAGVVTPLVITSARFQQGRPVIGVHGIDDMNGAAALAGVELRIPVERLAGLPEGAFYHHDLIGCQVQTVDGVDVGVVSKVEGTMGRSRLVLDTERGEVLIPLVPEICTTIDPASRRIVIAPPEGLLELNIRSIG